MVRAGGSGQQRRADIRAGIVGATGLVGEGLVRVLLGHPEAELSCLTSDHAAGEKVGSVLSSLAGGLDIELVRPDIERLSSSCDVVFLAKKTPDSMKLVPELLSRGVKCVDIGGEFRFRDAAVYERWYGNSHEAPELARAAVWGLPELYRERIKSADLVANPGCYPTGAVLGMLPFLRAKLIEPEGIIVSAVSGVSGAGRTYNPKSDNLFLSCYENLRAYGVGTHRHTPEIEQALSEIAGAEVKVTFVPQLAPMDRGILTIIYAKPAGDLDSDVLRSCLTEFASSEPFIRMREAVGLVRTSDVRGTNYCDVACTYIERTGAVVIATATDNTVKGASGQAVQNMNIMFGLDERTGLDRVGM